MAYCAELRKRFGILQKLLLNKSLVVVCIYGGPERVERPTRGLKTAALSSELRAFSLALLL